jgi:hypothetical protein
MSGHAQPKSIVLHGLPVLAEWHYTAVLPRPCLVLTTCASGRQYKAVLEADPSQVKAFINWGRALGLRADMARAMGELAEGNWLNTCFSEHWAAHLRRRLGIKGRRFHDSAHAHLGRHNW